MRDLAAENVGRSAPRAGAGPRSAPARGGHNALMADLAPVQLAPNQLRRNYRGGAALADLRGVPALANAGPEDWVASTTTAWGAASSGAGLSRLPDGRLLRDAVAGAPEAYLGPAHAARHGADTGLLVKLLDAGERLPVHHHPDGAFARRHLGLAHGKTEAWYVTAVSTPDPVVWIGFQEPVAAETLAEWVAGQDSAAMLGALHRVPVRPGDAIFVPAGTPHAIGEGLLIVELQEPSDLSVIMEWIGVDGPREGELGLGWELALSSADRGGWEAARLAGLRREPDAGEVAELLPAAADPFFRAQRVRPRRRLSLEPAFAVLAVTAGTGRLRAAAGAVELRRGDTVLVPHAAGESEVEGAVELVRCLPPAPW
jgi:mannose-6-phosphate isomerase